MPLPMLDEICKYLVNQGITVGTPATPLVFATSSSVTGANIFSVHMPNSPDACVALVPYGGGLPHLTDNIDEPVWQVHVRDPIYTSAEATIQAIGAVLHGVWETLLVAGGDWYFNRVFALQSFVSLGRDERQRHGLVQNLRCFCRYPNRSGGYANIQI